MVNFNKFILEVLSLRFEHLSHNPPGKDYYSIDLSHYSYESNYNVRLSQLKELALTDLLFLPDNHVAVSIKRLDLIWQRLRNAEVVCNEPLAAIDVMNEPSYFSKIIRALESVFTIENSSDYRMVTDLFDMKGLFWNLRDALSSKRTAVENLIDDLKAISGAQALENRARVNRGIILKTYNWIDGETKAGILKLFHIMNDCYVVQTSLAEFQGVFVGGPVESIKPLKWKSNNASELLYFLIDMMERGLITDERERMSYERLKSCFVKVNGEIFKEDFKSLKQRLDIDLSQQKKVRIDNELSQFL